MSSDNSALRYQEVEMQRYEKEFSKWDYMSALFLFLFSSDVNSTNDNSCCVCVCVCVCVGVCLGVYTSVSTLFSMSCVLGFTVGIFGGAEPGWAETICS